MFLHELAAGASWGRAALAEWLSCGRATLPGESIRGNVDTRIKKLRRGEYDAIVLAAAGQRLDRLDEASEILEPDDMMPAPAQGEARCSVAATEDAQPSACD